MNCSQIFYNTEKGTSTQCGPEINKNWVGISQRLISPFIQKKIFNTQGQAHSITLCSNIREWKKIFDFSRFEGNRTTFVNCTFFLILVYCELLWLELYIGYIFEKKSCILIHIVWLNGHLGLWTISFVRCTKRHLVARCQEIWVAAGEQTLFRYKSFMLDKFVLRNRFISFWAILNLPWYLCLKLLKNY